MYVIVVFVSNAASVDRVMSQVSCEVTTPKQTRPNEGLLYVNTELSPMAAPHFEAGRFVQETSSYFMLCLLESCFP